MTILDTNVASELMRPRPQSVVLDWLANQPAEQIHVTAITVAEVLLGIELLPAGKRRESIQAAADRTFEVFGGHILAFDEGAAHAFSLIASSRRKKGKPMSEFDAQIAAIASAHGATLATRNIADFQGCGVQLVNPWKE